MSACAPEDDLSLLQKPDWHPALALPLINSTLTIGDLLDQAGEQDYIEREADNKITLVYGSQLYSKKGNALFPIPDVRGTLTDSLSALILPFVNGAELQQLHLISGLLSYTIPAADTQAVNRLLRLPFVSLEGKPFSEALLPAFPQSSQFSLSGSFDLSGYQLDFTKADSLTNAILVEYIAGRANDLQNKAADYPLDIRFENLLFEYAKGYLGRINFAPKTDRINIAIFNNWVSGTVYLENPHIALKLNNSFGFPITAEFTTLEAVNGSSKQLILPYNSLEDTFSVNYPGIETFGNTVQTNLQLTTENSNLGSFLAISPQQLQYALAFAGNVAVDTTEVQFITAESELAIDLALKLPMQGRIDGMRLLDTLDLEIATQDLLQQVDEAHFKLQTENMLPLEVSLQLFFADENYVLLDSLLLGEEKILQSGSIHESGKVITAGNKTTYIHYNRQRSAALDQARHILLKVRLATANNGASSISLYADNLLGVTLGVLAKPSLP